MPVYAACDLRVEEIRIPVVFEHTPAFRERPLRENRIGTGKRTFETYS
jgi:hypothetical protein